MLPYILMIELRGLYGSRKIWFKLAEVILFIISYRYKMLVTLSRQLICEIIIIISFSLYLSLSLLVWLCCKSEGIGA